MNIPMVLMISREALCEATYTFRMPVPVVTWLNHMIGITDNPYTLALRGYGLLHRDFLRTSNMGTTDVTAYSNKISMQFLRTKVPSAPR